MNTELRDGWHWPVKDQGAWQWCYQQWRDLPERICAYVTEFGLCIHAGANVGLYAKDYAAKFARVLAFEPEPTNFWCLANNVPEANVIKIQSALGNEHGWCEMVCPTGEMNCGGYQVRIGKRVPVLRIDDFAATEVGLIHLDVESYEFEVLQGAAETLERCAPVICLETINPGKDDMARGYLREFGYEVAEKLEHDTIFRK